ncbi:MAG: leucine-rich repeat protein [Acutalibacteraceae bacterium]
MKKLFCLVLCLIIAFSSISVFAQAYEVENNTLSPLEAFTQKLAQLTKEYDSDNNISTFSIKNVDENELAHKDSTKRLIVKAEGKIDTLNAVEYIDGYNDLHILQYASYSDMEKALAFYENCENVIYVQEDRINKTSEYEIVEDNALFSDNSGDETSVNAVVNPMQDCADAHGFTALRKKLDDENIIYEQEITVAVIDTGVEADHELLAGRVEPTGFDSIDGVSCADQEGHGTHVAGIIVANTLDNVTVKPYRVLDENGEGTDAQVVLGIEAAIADGVDVINMSLGRRGESELMEEAIKKANDAGIIVVVAAGNEGFCMDAIPCTPACCENVITVTACDKNFTTNMPFSNFGSMCETGAIGDSVKSSYLNNTYVCMSGTSMAAPFVAAGVTYLLLDNPNLSYDEVVGVIDKFEYKNFMFLEYILEDDIVQLSEPKFSVEGGGFTEEFYLELTCEDDTATIYYNYASGGKYNWNIYVEPLKIKYSSVITAYVAKKGAISSDKITYIFTRAFPSDEYMYEITEDGVITEYLGPCTADDKELIIPDTIKGITPTAIGVNAFSGMEYFEYITVPDTVTNLESGAFKGCRNLKYFIGKGVTVVGSVVFGGCCALIDFIGGDIEEIGSSGFQYCESLRFIDTRNLKRIEGGAFSHSNAIQTLVSDKLTYIGTTAFEDTNIKTVDCPNVTDIGGDAFCSCDKLETVSIPKVTEFKRGLFAACNSLKEINAPLVKRIGSYVFDTCTSLEGVNIPLVTYIDNQAFENCNLIKSFDFPMLTYIGEQAFRECTSLEIINAHSVTHLDNYAFMNCSSLKEFDCSLVTDFGIDVFRGCSSLNELEFNSNLIICRNTFYNEITVSKVIFNNPKKIVSFPANVPVALPSSLTDIVEDDPENVIIYGTKGSYAEDWAYDYDQTFIEITPQSAIFNDVEPYFLPDDEPLYFDVIGFNRTYQWYGNNTKSTTGGTAIQGATSSKFSPTDYDTIYDYYYCIATSKDGANDTVYITSDLCTYCHIPIKPKGNTTINFKDSVIFTSDTVITKLTDIVALSENEKYIPVPSFASKTNDYFGTASSVIVYTNGVPSTTFSVVVYGDLNGDSVCDVLDCAQAALVVNGLQSIDGVYAMAADSNADNEIDINDYQFIVNKAIA